MCQVQIVIVMRKDSLLPLLALYMFNKKFKNALWSSEFGVKKNQFHSLYMFEKIFNFLENNPFYINSWDFIEITFIILVFQEEKGC